MSDADALPLAACLRAWAAACEQAFANGTSDVVALLDELSSAWCPAANRLLAATAEEIGQLPPDQRPEVVLRDGPRGLLSLCRMAVQLGCHRTPPATVAESITAYWAAVADDCELCASLLALWRFLPASRGPYAPGLEEASQYALRCLTQVCEARGRAVASASTASTRDWVFAGEDTLQQEAVSELCDAYQHRADAVAGALDFAAAAAAAFRGTERAIQSPTGQPALTVAEAIRARMTSESGVFLPTALAEHINRGSTGYEASDMGLGDSEGTPSLWACTCLAAELLEPPCLFRDYDLYVLLDVVLRQLDDTDVRECATDTAALFETTARLEFVREAVLTEWFARERHRVEDIVATASRVEAAAEEFADGETKATLTCLAREITRSVTTAPQQA